MDIYKKHGWGKIYYKYLGKGCDHGYAAYMADSYCERKDQRVKESE